MKNAAAQSPPTGENPTKENRKTKSSAGRMGSNPYDPLTTTNFWELIMAKPDHTSAAPDDARIPTNPLSRPYWTLAEADLDQQDAATLAGLTTAIRALTRVLANSEAFRDLHTNSQSDTIEPGCCPLDAPTTEGLFAALYFLSEQAEGLSQLPISAPVDSDNVPY